MKRKDKTGKIILGLALIGGAIIIVGLLTSKPAQAAPTPTQPTQPTPNPTGPGVIPCPF